MNRQAFGKAKAPRNGDRGARPGAFAFFAAFLVILGQLVSGCGPPSPRIIVFSASSLAAPMRELTRIFRDRTGVEVRVEFSGSNLAVRKVTELGRSADLVISADPGLVSSLMIPDHAQWQVTFLKSRMVIAFQDSSLHSKQIDSSNWHEILRLPGVRTGIAQPDLEPAGYRAVLTWKLADLHYGTGPSAIPGWKSISAFLESSITPGNIKHDVAALVAPLQAQIFDYAFIYDSMAVQHRLRNIDLPREIDLSDPNLDPLYGQATCEVKIPGRQSIVQRGTTVTYSATVPNSAENSAAAAAFLSFMMSSDGARVFRASSQGILERPVILPQGTDRVPPRILQRVKSPWK